jgi:uncharacterized protein YdaU (DUF1376 family)
LNFYERHIGDYIKKTSHLSLLEHGVLTRLRDVYLDREEPIPEARAARLVGARTEPETEALQVVLQEFFQLRDGMWVCDECEALIAAYAAGEPEREVKKANEDNRLKRHRQERAALFKLLTDRGEHAPWNIGMEELRQRVAALQVPGPETPAATQPATAPATPATATHYPLPTTQSPGIGKQGADAPLSPAAPTTPTPPPMADLLGEGTGEPAAIPPCPLKQLVALFAARVPELPKPRFEMWKDSAGAEAMRQRWKWLLGPDAVREDNTRYASNAAEAIDWFGRFFDTVKASDFLTGRRGDWKACDLAWLMKRENFMKVVQGNYTNREHA